MYVHVLMYIRQPIFIHFILSFSWAAVCVLLFCQLVWDEVFVKKSIPKNQQKKKYVNKKSEIS